MAIAAGYFPVWTGGSGLINASQNFKWVLPFEVYDTGGAGGTGALTWDGTPPSTANLATMRARGQKIILSIGGDAGDMNFTSRTKSTTCVNSIKSLISASGGNFDGIDWDNYEGVASPSTAEYLWMGQQLKAFYGSQFIIWSAVGAWKTDTVTAAFQNALIAAGVLDYVMPMFYGDALFAQNFILNDPNEGLGKWGANLGGYDHLCIGFGIDDTDATTRSQYMTAAECLSTWNAAIAAHPTLAGAALWTIQNDQAALVPNAYATTVAPVVLAAGSGTTVNRTVTDPVGVHDTMTVGGIVTQNFTQTITDSVSVDDTSTPYAVASTELLSDPTRIADSLTVTTSGGTSLPIVKFDQASLYDVVLVTASGRVLTDQVGLRDSLTIISPDVRFPEFMSVSDRATFVYTAARPKGTRAPRRVWTLPAVLVYSPGTKVDNTLYQTLRLDVDTTDLEIIPVGSTVYAVDAGPGAPVG